MVECGYMQKDGAKLLVHGNMKPNRINIPEVMKTGSAKLNFLCNFSQLPCV